jgi:hypothetical protein
VAAASPQSLDYGRQPRRNWKRLILKASLILGVSCIIVVASLYLLLWYLFGEMLFSTGSANAVVIQVMNHTLVPNAFGIVTLPQSMASKSQDGKVYVTVDSAGTTWILFPTSRGKGDNVTAYVYHSMPVIGPSPAEITLDGPDLGPNKAAPLAYTVDRQIDANWYHVVWNMD